MVNINEGEGWFLPKKSLNNVGQENSTDNSASTVNNNTGGSSVFGTGFVDDSDEISCFGENNIKEVNGIKQNQEKNNNFLMNTNTASETTNLDTAVDETKKLFKSVSHKVLLDTDPKKQKLNETKENIDKIAALRKDTTNVICYGGKIWEKDDNNNMRVLFGSIQEMINAARKNGIYSIRVSSFSKPFILDTRNLSEFNLNNIDTGEIKISKLTIPIAYTNVNEHNKNESIPLQLDLNTLFNVDKDITFKKEKNDIMITNSAGETKKLCSFKEFTEFMEQTLPDGQYYFNLNTGEGLYAKKIEKNFVLGRQKFFDNIKLLEGKSNKCYIALEGNVTFGYGHVLKNVPPFIQKIYNDNKHLEGKEKQKAIEKDFEKALKNKENQKILKNSIQKDLVQAKSNINDTSVSSIITDDLKLTNEQIDLLLESDAKNSINDFRTRFQENNRIAGMTSYQICAAIDYIYNVGAKKCPKFIASLKNNKLQEAQKECDAIGAGKKSSEGLAKRNYLRMLYINSSINNDTIDVLLKKLDSDFKNLSKEQQKQTRTAKIRYWRGLLSLA